jgi:hypothetical protein
MTLLEIERLVRKITDVLQHVGNAAIAPKLAEDFAAACHAANLRLQQCEAMIKAADRHQAIQLAETSPNLLDLVTILEFRGSDDWRGYCQQNALGIADRIDGRSVRALNDCYAQGITTDHPLYANYRRAVLSRNDEDALKSLQSITRLNPADSNAASELTRLDAKVLAARLQHLAELLERADPAHVVAEIESIEAVGFENRTDGEVWRKAQAIRCKCLLEEAARHKGSSRWMDALANLDFIHRLQEEFKVELPAPALQQLDALDTWTRGEQEKARKEREFQSLLAELHYRIQQSEEKDTSARYVLLPELRDDYEALHKVWRSLGDFTRPIPVEATSSFHKRSALLEGEIARRTAIRRRIIVSASAAIVLVGGFLGWFTLGRMKAHDFTKQLQAAISQRQAHTAARLLERVRTSEKQLLSQGSVNTAAAAAETFVTREKDLLANFEAAFNKLPQEFPAKPDAHRLAAIASQLALTRNALDALAPDLKQENEPRFDAFERRWQIFRSETAATVNSLFDKWVASAEKECHELDYRSALEKTTAQMAIISDLVQKISDCESGFTNYLSLRSDLLERSVAVRSKFTAFDRELKKLDGGMDAIRKARAMKEFSDGITVIVSSEFSASPAATAATATQSLNASDETVLRTLLGMTNASTWAYIEKGQSQGFVPEAAMPAERQMLKQLKDDPAISSDHRFYRLWLDPQGTKFVEWITVGPFFSSTGWTHINAWAPFPAATTAAFAERDYGCFDGQYRLSPTQPVYRVEELGSRKEAAAFYSIGLGSVWPGGQSYAKPLLEVLGSLKDSREGSSIFRAYLFLRLVDLMNLQPDAWGLNFCPAIREHEEQIRSIVGEPINSGDWFVPIKVSSHGAKLEQFFGSVKSISYAKQAAGLLALARAASKSGLRYAGFVGLDGKPNIVEGSTFGELWGYSANGKQPLLMAAAVDVNKAFMRQAMPLSPLFSLANPRKEYLANAGVVPGDPSFQGVLPPLFQEQTQPKP